MIHAIIDIGSNTIRMAVYKEEKKKTELLFSKKYMAGLASYVKEGWMSEEGINRATEILLEFKKIVQTFRIKSVAAFATAALRNALNSEAAVNEIVSRTGIEIEVISGNDEAILDFIGATNAMDIENGILIDVGGASTELVVYEAKQIMQTVSLPIGSLNAYTDFVKRLIPTKEERKLIKQAVLNELDRVVDFTYGEHPVICGVGGSIRAAQKLNNALFRLSVGQDEIKAPNIKKMIKLLEHDGKDEEGISIDTLETLLKIVPDRIRTILPGLIILNTLAKRFKSEVIRVSAAGVREGYLYDRMLKKGTEDEKDGKNEKKEPV